MTATLFTPDELAVLDQALAPTIAWHRGDASVWWANCCGTLTYVPQADRRPHGDTCNVCDRTTAWRKVPRPTGPFRAHTGEHH